MVRLSPLPPWSIACVVTSVAPLGAGFAAAMMARLTGVQPAHWRRCWNCAALVGVTTIGLHGFGEPSGGATLHAWSFADTTANLLFAWLVLIAALRDLASTSAQRRGRLMFGAITALGISHVGAETFLGAPSGGFESGALGALSLSQLALVINYAAVFAIFWRGRARMPLRAQRLLPLLGSSATVGLLFAMPNGDRVDFGFVAYHAIFHLFAAFLVMLLWIVQEIRFSEPRA